MSTTHTTRSKSAAANPLRAERREQLSGIMYIRIAAAEGRCDRRLAREAIAALVRVMRAA